MCGDNITRYLCGHKSTTSVICNSALEVGIVDKRDCAFYQSISSDASKACGTGGFYCKQTPDGNYLDEAYQHIQNAPRMMHDLNNAIQAQHHTLQNFHNDKASKGMTRVLREQQPEAKALTAYIKQLMRERQTLFDNREAYIWIIEEAKNFYQQRATQMMYGSLPVAPHHSEFCAYAHGVLFPRVEVMRKARDQSQGMSSQASVSQSRLALPAPPIAQGANAREAMVVSGMQGFGMGQGMEVGGLGVGMGSPKMGTLGGAAAQLVGSAGEYLDKGKGKQRATSLDDQHEDLLRRSSRYRERHVNYAKAKRSASPEKESKSLVVKLKTAPKSVSPFEGISEGVNFGLSGGQAIPDYEFG